MRADVGDLFVINLVRRAILLRAAVFGFPVGQTHLHPLFPRPYASSLPRKAFLLIITQLH